ncbi:mannitol dehydrogenase family protein [Enterococcus sp. DIV0876]|uniref:mannitol dehydrogenase family protein n=1 Tax=Enterococcus sp. DIV0876 TaxID=2774633 RepID=UPI003D2FE1D7
MFDLDVLRAAGVNVPKMNKEDVRQKTQKEPQWVHFGGGNLYRAFHAEVAQTLIDQGVLDTGIIVCETFDEEVIDRVYTPYQQDIVEVIMHEKGRLEQKLLQSTAASYFCHPSREESYQSVREIFKNKTVQMVTVTITEKGYGLTTSTGAYLQSVEQDIIAGPHAATHTMSILVSLLWDRFQSSAAPLALVSTDNFSQNGQRFQEAIWRIAKEWALKGHISQAFVDYLHDKEKISFPWSMIDRITPHPSPVVLDQLTQSGIEGLSLIHTSKGTNIAPFANTEATHYLVIEDDFPNGRPDLTKGGVILTNRAVVDKVDIMKVTTCLNPLHTAMSVFGCLLGFQTIADEMADQDIRRLVKGIGYLEGLPVVEDPGIIQPKAFIDEVIDFRLPNPLIPDTPQRIATDTSQKMAIRFGETIKKYVERAHVEELQFIPLAIAGWMRYLLALNDEGQPFDPSPDPLLSELQNHLSEIKLGATSDTKAYIQPILSNEALFGLDLYKAGLGEKIQGYFEQMLTGPGAVRSTLHETVGGVQE